MIVDLKSEQDSNLHESLVTVLVTFPPMSRPYLLSLHSSVYQFHPPDCLTTFYSKGLAISIKSLWFNKNSSLIFAKRNVKNTRVTAVIPVVTFPLL